MSEEYTGIYKYIFWFFVVLGSIRYILEIYLDMFVVLPQELR